MNKKEENELDCFAFMPQKILKQKFKKNQNDCYSSFRIYHKIYVHIYYIVLLILLESICVVKTKFKRWKKQK